MLDIWDRTNHDYDNEIELKSKEVKFMDDTTDNDGYAIPSDVGIKPRPEKDDFVQLQENPAYGVTNYKQ